MAMNRWDDGKSETPEDLYSFAKPELRITDYINRERRVVSIDATTEYIRTLNSIKPVIIRVLDIMKLSGVEVDEIASTTQWPSLTFDIPMYLDMDPMSKRSRHILEGEERSALAVGTEFKHALKTVSDESEIDYKELYGLVAPLFAAYSDYTYQSRYIFLQV